jgi:hypothetical protein
MEENIFASNQPADGSRSKPEFLKVLCILSFIWSGLIVFILFLCLVFSSFIFKIIHQILSGEIAMPTLDAKQEEALQSFMQLGQGKFIGVVAAVIIFYMTSVLGVFKMWRLQKSGFYIYAIINLLGVGFDLMSGSFFAAIISISFIAMYYTNLKHLK